MGKRTTFFLDGPYEEFLKYEVQRTSHPVSAVIRNCILSSREYADYRKALPKPSVEPKTTTTVVADNPNPVFIHNLCFHGVNLDHHRCPDCAAANREPTLKETMAQLAEVTRIDPSDACVHGVHIDEHCRECGPNCPTCGNEFPCYECDMKEGKA